LETSLTTEQVFTVGKVQANGTLRDSIRRVVDLVGGMDSVISHGDTVTIKPNLNTADPYPASSDPAFIEALGFEILDAGADKLRIIDSSMFRLNSREVATEIGLNEVAENLDAELVFLDEHPWEKIKIDHGTALKKASTGRSIFDSDKLVLAPCIKTHFLAKFTGSMKLFIGWMGKNDRLKMHMRKLEEKVVEFASYFKPNLIVMDARKVFVTGGPASGEIESPNLILASKDMVSIDVEGVKILQSYGADNKLDDNVWEVPQIKHAVKIGLGAKSDADIRVIEG
jgi:uncharacterized protein (DUF362 family)